MKASVNNDNEVCLLWNDDKIIPKNVKVVDFPDKLVEKFYLKKSKFFYINGQIVEASVEEQQNIEKLRLQRKTECFSLINRGQLWYDQLSLAQKVELQIWYQAWLNVTQTNIIPTKPSWLK